MRRALVLAAAGLVSGGALLVYHELSERVTPASQPRLARLDKDDIGMVRDQFNDSADAVRILVMLSPT